MMQLASRARCSATCELFCLLGVEMCTKGVHNRRMKFRRSAHDQHEGSAHTMKRSARTLNEMPLHECYAFELRIIIENKREDGMRSSPQRRLAARNELAARAGRGDEKAVAQLDILGCCPHGYPDQGDGCVACSDDHSASRRVDVLAAEAPHLVADPDDVRRRVSVSVGDIVVIDDVRYMLDARKEHDHGYSGYGLTTGDRYILRKVER